MTPSAKTTHPNRGMSSTAAPRPLPTTHRNMSSFLKRFHNPLPADAVTIPASARGTFHLPPTTEKTDVVKIESKKRKFRRFGQRTIRTRRPYRQVASTLQATESLRCATSGKSPSIGQASWRWMQTHPSTLSAIRSALAFDAVRTCVEPPTEEPLYQNQISQTRP